MGAAPDESAAGLPPPGAHAPHLYLPPGRVRRPADAPPAASPATPETFAVRCHGVACRVQVWTAEGFCALPEDQRPPDAARGDRGGYLVIRDA